MIFANPHLAQTAKEIISDMFRWGVIGEGSKYFALDMRTISDSEAVATICALEAEGLISSDVNANPTSVYYVSDGLIADFIAENWRLNQ